jgi:hypothetical protein
MKATLFVLRRLKHLPTGPGPDRGRGSQVRLQSVPPYAMRYVLCHVSVLNADGQFDEEGRPLGFVVPYPDISVVVGNNGIYNGQS